MTGSQVRNTGGSGGMGGGTVTSVDVDGGATGLTTSGGPVVAAGVIILDGTLNIAHGGTGATTAPAALAALGGQTGIQFKDEGVNLGASGTVDTIDFVGGAVVATRVGNVVTVSVMAGGGTVTSVDADGGTTGMTFSGGPIVNAGVLTMDGVLNIAHGGTGATTAPAALANLGAGTVNSVDVSGGTTGLTTAGGPITNAGVITIAGTLNVANGGTGATTAAGARTNLNAQIGVQYEDEGVALGTPGTVDTIDFVGGGVSAIRVGNAVTVTVATPPAGTVTSVDGSGGVTGMTLTGGPITTTGTLTLGGTLAVGSGGTGATTAAGARTNLSAQLSQQFQDENVNLGTSGTVDIINFTGAGITASRAGNTIMVDVPSSGTVTSVDVSGGATGLIATGGPITSSGVITLSGVLDVDNGGTGAITAAGARTNLAASPNNASYVVIANNTELTSERALAIEAGVLNLTDAGVNSTVTVGVAANGITNAKIRASNSLSVIGRSVNSIGNVADIQATAGGNKVLRETGSTLAFSNWIGSDSTQATLGSTFAITSSGTYQDTGLSVSLDSNSVYLLIQQVRAIVNVSLLSTGGTIFTRLFNVTNAAAITNTELLASFSGALNTDSQQCGSGMTIFTTGAAAPTVRLEAQRASGPTYTTSSILSSTSGRTRLIAIKIGSA